MDSIVIIWDDSDYIYRIMDTMEKNNDSVLNELREKYRENPEDLIAAISLVQYYSDHGWFNEAVDICKEALEVHKNDYSLLLEGEIPVSRKVILLRQKNLCPGYSD